MSAAASDVKLVTSWDQLERLRPNLQTSPKRSP